MKLHNTSSAISDDWQIECLHFEIAVLFLFFKVSWLLQMSKKTKDSWVRIINVSDPVLHKKGYTLYKVTSKVCCNVFMIHSSLLIA